MPVIPTYSERGSLEPGRMPKPQLSGAEAAANFELAQAEKGAGAALAGFGNTLYDHIERRQTESDNFNDKLARSALDNDIQSLLEKRQRDMKPDGSGFRDEVLPELDKLAQQRLGGMSDRNRDRFQKSWQVERGGWDNKITQLQKGRQDGFQSGVLDGEANKVLDRIAADPAQAESLIEQQAAFERDSSLPIDVKVERERKWKQRAQEFAVQVAAGKDPRAARQLLGLPTEEGERLPDASQLRLKSGEAVAGGDAHAGTIELARNIQGAIPDLKYFSAINDRYHQGTGSRHAKGLAFDFTVNDGAKSGEAADKARGLLVRAGLKEGADFTVIDEYKSPSARSTGGHIHVDFKTQDAADRFAGKGAPGATFATVADRIIGVESGGDATARNPRSSAAGAGQFIDSTWIGMVRRYRPDIAGTMGRDDILALRDNAGLAREMTLNYAKENSETLKAAGITPTAGRVYLAHFLGPEGAKKVLSADPNTPVSDLVGADAVKANASILSGKSAGDVAAWADAKMGGRAVASRAMPAFDTSAIPAERKLALVQQAAGREREALAEFERAATNRALQYETALQNYSVGRGPLPSREDIESDPQLSIGKRLAVIKQLDGLIGGTTAVGKEAAADYTRGMLDAQSGKAPLFDRASIENDPRLSKEQQNQLLSAHRSTELGIQREVAGVAAKAASDANEALERQILEMKRGGPLFARSLIENNSTITEAQRNNQLRAYDAAAADANKLGVAMVKLNSGVLDGTGMSKDTQDAVNTIASSDIPLPAMLFDQGDQGAGLRARVATMAQRTGAVPTVAVEMIRSGLNATEPAKVETALQFATQISMGNENAFASTGARKEIEDGVLAFDFYVNTLSMEPRAAAAKIAERNDPEWKRRNRKDDQELNVFDKQLRDKNAVNDLRTHLTGFAGFGGADLSFTQTGLSVLEGDFVKAARARYAEHGDEALAKKQATVDLLGDPSKNRTGAYGISEQAGRKVLMKYPPEAAAGYRPMPDGSKAYIGDQAIEHIKATTGQEVGRDKLVFDYAGPAAAQLFRNGDPVPYRLRYFDERGTLQEVRGNTSMGWVADPLKARAAFDAKARGEGEQAIRDRAYGLVPSDAPIADVKTAIARQDKEERDARQADAAARQPAMEAEVARSREIGRSARANQMPDEVDRSAIAPAADLSGQERERQAYRDEELRRSRDLARSARGDRRPTEGR